MGCTSSKVQQKPLEEDDEVASCNESTAILSTNSGHGEAEESRPASPVALQPNSSISTQGGPSLPPLATQGTLRALTEGSDAWRAAHHIEVGGETITDESGLQMRTPRLHSDRGLHFAAKSGDLALVHKLLSANSNRGDSSIVDGTASEDTAATAETTTTIGKAVPLSEGTAPNSPSTDLDERGMWGNTPLLVATQYAHPQVALALIRGGANGCLENERQATALHYSCAEGLIDVSRALLLVGKRVEVDPPAAMVHHPGVYGGRTVPVTPLSAAALGGHTDLVQLLVEHGAQVDRKVLLRGADGKERGGGSSCADGKGWSALAGAARFGHTKTCLALIEHGANFMDQDSDGRTPLMHAIHGGHEETSLALIDAARQTAQACLLSDAHESPTSEAHSGLAPLHLACYKKMSTLVNALLAEGAMTEPKDASGATPLLHACRKGAVTCARELLDRGADPLAADRDGVTPLKAAQSRKTQPGGEELIQLMEAAAGAAPSASPSAAPSAGPSNKTNVEGSSEAVGAAESSGRGGGMNIAPRDNQGQQEPPRDIGEKSGLPLSEDDPSAQQQPGRLAKGLEQQHRARDREGDAGMESASADLAKEFIAFQVAGDLVDGMMTTTTTLPNHGVHGAVPAPSSLSPTTQPSPSPSALSLPSGKPSPSL